MKSPDKLPELPRCGKCGEVMTPQNAKIHPEYWLHDKCLPESCQYTEREAEELVRWIDRINRNYCESGVLGDGGEVAALSGALEDLKNRVRKLKGE